jgi:hypothetical protein
MYKMGQTMEEVSEDWVEVMTTNRNGPKGLNLKEKILRVQLGKSVVVCMHIKWHALNWK